MRAILAFTVFMLFSAASANAVADQVGDSSSIPNQRDQASAPDEQGQAGLDYLRNNFGIPEQLSDCDKPSHPVGDETTEANRESDTRMNSMERSSCRERWFEHQRELNDEKEQAARNALANTWGEMGNNIAAGKPIDYTYHDMGLKDIIKAETESRAAPLQTESAIESAGFSRLQATAATDLDQAAIQEQMKREMARGGPLQMTHDQATKIMIFNRELEALREEQANEPWERRLKDSVLDFLFMGFGHFFAATGNIAGGADIELTDLPSTRENKEAATLWGLPVDQFAAVAPQVFANFRKALFGTDENLTQAVRVAEEFERGGLNQSASFWENWSLAGAASAFVLGLSFLAAITGRWVASPRQSHPATAVNSVLPSSMGSVMARYILVCATAVAILMFIFPPTNRVFGPSHFFVGWQPLWNVGVDPNTYLDHEIAYPILLIEWGLLALVAFTAAAFAGKTG